MKWFSRENVHFRCFFGLLVGKLRQGCQNNSLRWQKNNWGKWLYTSKELILDIVISHSTELFVFWLKTWAKVFALFLPKAAWTNIKNGLFSRRLTHSIKWFSRENFRSRCFNWILRGKTQAELSKKGLQWQKNNWGQRFFTSNGLILDIVMSHRTIFFGIWLKILNRDVNTAFSASRLTTSGKTSFLE